MDLFEAITKRRDTRHFTTDSVPQNVLNICLKAAKNAPSVGLTEPSRFIFIQDIEVRKQIHDLFLIENEKAILKINDQEKRNKYKNIKLEGIKEAPLGMIVCADYNTLKEFTIGTTATKETLDWSVCCAIQNFWLALTSQGYSMGWVSIIDFERLKEILNIPESYKPLGYFCIGKPATNYDNMPMLKKLGWSND